MAESARFRQLVCLLSIASLVSMVTGCGGNAGAKGADGATRVLSEEETTHLLLKLPYHYKFKSVSKPAGAEGVVAGRAIGRHQTILNFGIALGHGHLGVPVPQAGISESYGFPKGGFIFTDDIQIRGSGGRLISNPKFHTAAQWEEANRMSVAMTDKLCLAATGDHCPP